MNILLFYDIRNIPEDSEDIELSCEDNERVVLAPDSNYVLITSIIQ